MEYEKCDYPLELVYGFHLHRHVCRLGINVVPAADEAMGKWGGTSQC